MADQILNIADKTTLDSVYSKLTDENTGLAAIKNSVGSGGRKVKYANEPINTGSNPNVDQVSVSTIPYNFYNGAAVVYNNEIHLLGGTGGYKMHYKWDGVEWTEVSTLPYTEFYYSSGGAVVYNNEIHILGSHASPYTQHYKWDGSTWTRASTLPYGFYSGAAVVYNDEIHIMGGGNSESSHYKWNGSTWTADRTLAYSLSSGSAVVYNNEIHVMGGGLSPYTNHYKWDGSSASSWVSVSTLPYGLNYGPAIVYNDEIHIMGGTAGYSMHYKWDGSTWTQVNALPYISSQSDSVIYDNNIHILGSSNGNYYNAHYIVASATCNMVVSLYLLNGSKVYCNTLSMRPITLTNITKFDDGWECSAAGSYQFAYQHNAYYRVEY